MISTHKDSWIKRTTSAFQHNTRSGYPTVLRRIEVFVPRVDQRHPRAASIAVARGSVTHAPRTLIAGVVAVALSLSSPFLAAHAWASAREPHTVSYLLRVATAFNDNYAANRDALVYERWDAPSQRVISEAAYVHRHELCPNPPGAALVEGAYEIAGGYWAVHYEISGSRLTDYWHYVGGRWRFDLLRSNPSSVRLYRLSFAAYVSRVGCTH